MKHKFQKPKSWSAAFVALCIALVPATIIGVAMGIACCTILGWICGLGAFGFSCDVLFFATEDNNDDWSY